MRTYVPVPETGVPTRSPAADPLAAIGKFLRSIGEWLSDRLDATHRAEVEAYLSKASDNVDLEQRIRRLERNAFFSRYY